MRFHINPNTGNPGRCSAQVGACPFGDEGEHYPSKEDARRGFEAKQEGSLAASLKKDESKLTSDGWLKEKYAVGAAPRGVSCPHCGRAANHLDARNLVSNEWVHCPCGERYDVGDMQIELTPENPSYRFLKDKESVKEATWFHATDKEDWLVTESAASFQAHVGTEAAAFDRAITNYVPHSQWASDSFYLYEVRIDPDALVADQVAKDDNAATVGEEDAEVTRYINAWEDMASVSLAVSSKRIQVVGKRVVSKQEAHERITPYNVKDPEDEGRDEVDAYNELRKQRLFPDEANVLTPEDEQLALDFERRLMELQTREAGLTR